MIRIETTFTGPGGTPWLSVMYFEGVTLSEAQAANTAVGTFWGAVDNLMHTAVLWTTGADARVIDPTTGIVTTIHGVTPVTGAGSQAGELLPRTTQGLIRWFTSAFVGGRQLRGRTFIPGLTESSNDNGRILPASITSLQTAADALIASASAELMIYTRTFNNNFAVTSANIWNEFATLRSRRD